ncbi:carbamoyltransferase C-terminal domain-containing protein [Rhizobium rhizogenes]|uniref:carbamoyltransferase C-terminal domain-containing protein n=1 Tax=Rhizobium rhizogenes TaxID=359 RepID=UPI001572D02B|nr:carbamoyltransferase C-terminal domain-containing protein [Rhizobium rhizogenes]NTG05517.1 nodulation protein [Rhizobium rhizogenes]NTG12117.1 nodulation protein [Rhizobium rhizogenes]
MAKLTLGLCGGLDPVHERVLDTPSNYTFDGAAALLADGVVVAAVEEERVNRIKHSSKLPVQSIKNCLSARGVQLTDIDRIAYYTDEASANSLLTRFRLLKPALVPKTDARTLFAQLLSREFNCQVDPSRLRFFEHRLTHAMPAMAQSGYDKSLVYVIDNAGGVFLGSRDDKGKIDLAPIMMTAPEISIQRLFHAIFPFLGLDLFDEYRAMALAAHGDPFVFSDIVGSFYELLPEGRYRFHLERVAKLIGVVEPRAANADFAQVHRDLASSLQRVIEDIALHVLKHHRHATGIDRVCLAGGMAENSTMSAALIYSGLFQEVFVHPAAYDAGCALGAALLAAQDLTPLPDQRVQKVGWGTPIETGPEIESYLKHWHGFVDIRQPTDIAQAVADELANGHVVGWAQGRAEFGSHALGQRTALADPRSPELSTRLLNALHRSTAYRPFSLAIMEEHADELFDLPQGVDQFRFAAVAARARESARALIPAAIQVDGMVRLQCVAREALPEFWTLLRSFYEKTGVPALLTASLNTEVEPTADSLEDTVVTFVTSGLDAMAVGPMMVTRSVPSWEERLSLRAEIPPYVQVVRTRRGGPISGAIRHELRTAFDPPRLQAISPALGEMLVSSDGVQSLAGAFEAFDHLTQLELTSEIEALWSQRFVRLIPPGDLGGRVQ